MEQNSFGTPIYFYYKMFNFHQYFPVFINKHFLQTPHLVLIQNSFIKSKHVSTHED